MSVHSVHKRDLIIQAGDVRLEGMLSIPENSANIVIFAHGSGSSRFSERNQYVADVLLGAGQSTLLFDLLTREEHEIDVYTRHLRFNIDLLTARLTSTVEWLNPRYPDICGRIGLFGASTGAAAALRTAADQPALIHAVVSRGGRPDLAMEFLDRVKAPTLLIVGGYDESVLEMNRHAASRLEAPHHLTVIPEASHLFEEPGALEAVAAAARDWFAQHLSEVRNVQ